MEVIRAIIMMIVGVMFLIILAQLALPLLGFFAILVIIGLIRNYFFRRSIQKRAEQFERTRSSNQKEREKRQNSSYTQSSSNVVGDVIDAEFTEEEIID